MDRERQLPLVEGEPPATSDEAEGGAHTPNPRKRADDPVRLNEQERREPAAESARRPATD
jgi:hypothetical protein